MGNNDGFTLLEVLIAMAIMVIALTSIFSLQSSAINASARARTMNIIAILAKNKMVETEYKFEGHTFEEVKKEENGAFEAPYDGYRWQTKISEIEFPNLSAGGGGGQGGGQGDQSNEMAQTVTKLLTKFLSQSVREVTVTILWKADAKDQSFTVTTYWVDLNHEFALTE